MVKNQAMARVELLPFLALRRMTWLFSLWYYKVKMMQQYKKISGFTLVELVIVIVVIGILSTLALLGFNNIQSDSRDQKRNSSVTVLSEAFEKYYDSHGEYPSCPAVTDTPVNVKATLGVNTDVLKAPKSSSDNSIVCADITPSTSNDVFAYIGDGSATCISGTSCLEYTIKYKEEATGNIISLKSRRGSNVITSGGTTLTATASGQTTINVNWTAVPNATSYIVQRSTSNTFPTGSTTVENTVAGLNTSNTGLRPGTTYYYRLQTVGSTGPSGSWTGTVYATTVNISAPTINSAVAGATRDKITLTLSSSTGANSYTVQRATNSGFTTGLTTFDPSATTTIVDDTAVVGTTYYYRAKATNTNNTGDSGWGASRTGSIQWICGDKGYVGTYPSCSLKVKTLSTSNYSQRCAIVDNQGENELYCWGWGPTVPAADWIATASTPKLMDTSSLGSKTITDVSFGGTNLCVVASGVQYCSNNFPATGFTSPSGGGLAGKTNVTRVVTTGSIQNGVDTRYQCAIAGGELYCWGWNSYGQTGIGSNGSAGAPVKVAGALAGRTVTDVSVDLQSTCAVASGQLYCWGGSLTSPSTTNYTTTPTLVPGLTGYTVTSVDLTNNHACVTTTASVVLCYGEGSGGHTYDTPSNPNPYNRYGTSSTATRTTATTVPVNIGAMPSRAATDIGGAAFTRCTLSTNNNVYCWADGINGTLGQGAFNIETDQPVQVSRTGVLGTKTITDLSGTCVVADDEVYCWGIGNYGGLGNGSTAHRNVPVKANIPATAF